MDDHHFQADRRLAGIEGIEAQEGETFPVLGRPRPNAEAVAGREGHLQGLAAQLLEAVDDLELGLVIHAGVGGELALADVQDILLRRRRLCQHQADGQETPDQERQADHDGFLDEWQAADLLSGRVGIVQRSSTFEENACRPAAYQGC